MRHTRRLRTEPGGVRVCACALLVFPLLLLFPPSARAQGDARQRIAAEVARLEKTLASLKLPAAEAEQRAAELRDAGEAVRAGRTFQALHRLQSPWAMLVAQEYVGAKSAVASGGVAAFEEEWKRLGVEVGEKERRLAAGAKGEAPLAARALAESAWTQAGPYYKSGRLYGLNTTVADGLIYLGIASASYDFALFCQAVPAERSGAAPKLRALAPELTRAEADTLAAYRRAEANAAQANQQQPLFNRVNSTLKLAWELERAGRHAGALHKYLEAVLLLGLADAQAPGPAESSKLNEQAAAFERRLSDAKADHSLGLLYLESTRAALLPAPEGRADAEALKRASVILARVLPAYFDYLRGDER